ncbi:hypothetical protein CCY99_05880 [Helicobacter sp. 16-1353]|uniref:type II secretion system protein n=1 Tax=Helicobacter sp. 16-1353 TaxID=2004996 RepID=UPI000DCF5D3D|nr:hypothetical protein [Helicobacter sp. 16-1353]RAX53119.1 hypothetical protein CCY99_05880 [Helicobacter sp. 16-1353]
MRKSFTMIEIVFVIVITGLVAVAGSMAIVQIMQNYAIQKEYAKLEIDSASTIRQVSKYLQDSIWDSIAIKNGNTYTAISLVNKAEDGLVSNNNQLVFIEKNMETINGYFGTYQSNNMNIPYFSGFINLSLSSGNSITTVFAEDRLLSLNSLVNSIALYFPFTLQYGTIVDKFYATNELARTALFKITNIVNNNTMILSHNPSQIGDVATIVNINPVFIQKNANGDLQLIKDSQTTTLAQSVSNFYIWSESQAGILRVRLCFINSTMDFMPEFCKEGIIMQ